MKQLEVSKPSAKTVRHKRSCLRTYVPYDVPYDIEASLFPNWTGVTQERIVSLNGDTLRLSTPPLLIKGKEQTARLVWKRARSK